MPRHWLVKTEGGCYSIDDFKRDRRTSWSGVRNYQARNFMRDGMKVGDGVLFYHSGADSPGGPGVAGIAKVCKAAHADLTALDPADQHYDPKSTKAEPIWMMVDIEFVERFPEIVSLAKLKAEPKLKGMLVLARGQRLSVMPVDADHFEIVRKLGKA
jgi:predicted RNA-binding protein with PUA-like domain